MATKYQRKMREAALREARLHPVTTLGPEREAFRALAANNRPPVDGSRVPSNQLMRGATYGDKQVDGKDLAANIATGNLRIAQKSGDAAGPLRENVGLTTQRGGVLDYTRPPDIERKPGAHPTHLGASYAAKIATLEANRPKLPERQPTPARKVETGSIIVRNTRKAR